MINGLTLLAICITGAAVFTGLIVIWAKKNHRIERAEPSAIVCFFIFFFFAILFPASWIRDSFLSKEIKQRQNRSNITDNHSTNVTLLKSNKVISINDSNFLGSDTIYRQMSYVYKNDTGEKLVIYMIKYTTSGYSEQKKAVGHVINPNDYFFWRNEEHSYMFQTPPQSITIVRHRKSSKPEKEFTYCTFLDYAGNVSDLVDY